MRWARWARVREIVHGWSVVTVDGSHFTLHASVPTSQSPHTSSLWLPPIPTYLPTFLLLLVTPAPSHELANNMLMCACLSIFALALQELRHFPSLLKLLADLCASSTSVGLWQLAFAGASRSPTLPGISLDKEGTSRHLSLVPWVVYSKSSPIIVGTHRAEQSTSRGPRYCNNASMRSLSVPRDSTPCSHHDWAGQRASAAAQSPARTTDVAIARLSGSGEKTSSSLFPRRPGVPRPLLACIERSRGIAKSVEASLFLFISISVPQALLQPL